MQGNCLVILTVHAKLEGFTGFAMKVSQNLHECVIFCLLITIFLLKIFQSSSSNDSTTWISFTYLFTFSIYVAVKRSSSPQGLMSIHCPQCKLLMFLSWSGSCSRATLALGVLCWMGAQLISILQLRSGTPYLKDFIGAGPQRLQCSENLHVFWTTHLTSS